MTHRTRGITNKEVLRYFQLALDDINWTIDQAKFDVLALKKNSAPGFAVFLCRFLRSIFMGQHHTRGLCGSRTKTILNDQRSTESLSFEWFLSCNGF